ncbi:CLUMA_CG002138, isoform A [Clunio marinus]|uniref:CLUMA_CG002138, isoform A n=1 Tax=Clunio marinus TaxID=568069 RepID=A0A1J1HQ72_9DIPT|nr:CLUMA_CG002138, isoform A [Clunio marinus]
MTRISLENRLLYSMPHHSSEINHLFVLNIFCLYFSTVVLRLALFPRKALGLGRCCKNVTNTILVAKVKCIYWILTQHAEIVT